MCTPSDTEEMRLARYIASAACSSLSCASSSSSSAVCTGPAHKIINQQLFRDNSGTARTRRELARWMVYWDVVCLRKPLVQLLLLQVCQFLLELVLWAL